MAIKTVPNIVRGHVPYEHAHEANHLIFNVLSLIHAATELNENGRSFKDPHELTCNQGMITCLLIQARDQASEAIKQLNV